MQLYQFLLYLYFFMEINTENSDFNKTFAPWISITYKMIDEYIADILLKENIQVTKQQWIILKILYEKQNEIIQNELAFITNRNKASLTRLISVMEKKHLVVRNQSENDARINLICITEKGKELFLKMKPLMLNSIQKIQSGLTQTEINTLIETLLKIQQNIQKQTI